MKDKKQRKNRTTPDTGFSNKIKRITKKTTALELERLEAEDIIQTNEQNKKGA